MSDPNDYEFWFNRAMKNIVSNGIIGDFKENLEKALILNPFHFDSWIYYASCITTMWENDKIVEGINKLFKYKPESTDSPNLFGYTKNKVKSYTDGDNPLKRRDSDMKYTLRYGGEWLITATYYWRKGKFQKAFNAFQNAFSFPRTRNQAIYWYIYLVVNLLNKEYNKAIEYGEKAVELDTNFKFAWQQLSKAYYFNKQYYNALESIEHALKIDKGFEKAKKLKMDIEVKIVETQRVRVKDIYFYHRQKLPKEEYEFLKALEKKCGKVVPKINKIEWDNYEGSFGFIVKEGHITELGLNYQVKNLKIIPESIKDLKHLEKLSIVSSHNLDHFPEGTIFLKKLRYLRYDHSPFTFNGNLSPKANTLPEIICNLKALEELNTSQSAINTLDECLIYLPNLKKIDISTCYNLKSIPPIFNKYFNYEEYQHPTRRFLVRKSFPIRDDKEEPTPHSVYKKLINKEISEAQALEILISIIKNEKLILKRVECLKTLNELELQNSAIFEILEKILNNEKSLFVRLAVIETLLNKFPNRVEKIIKSIVLNEGSIELIEIVKNYIEKNDSSQFESIKDLLDYLVILDIEKALGEKLPEIDNLEINKKKYQMTKRPHGYVKRNNRIIGLGLNTYYFNIELDKLPESIGDLTQLEELKLIDCRELTGLTNSIGKLKNLKVLNCTGCRKLKKIPESLGECRNLECLDLTECFSLEKLPETLGNLKKLSKLILKDCQSLNSLPNSIGNLNLLNYLSLENCISLNSLTDEINSLQNLEELNLEYCRKLKYLPNNFDNMKLLKSLELKCCTRLIEIPDSIFSLKSPEILDLSFCYSLQKLPESIANWKALKIITLKGCRELQKLPEKISELQSLEELNLTTCRKLENLPKSIGKLKKLKRIELSCCESLKKIPKSIISLHNLEDVNLDGCVSLTSPKNIGLLNNLKVYKLREKRPYNYVSELENQYENEISPAFMDNQYSLSNIKKYQETMNTKFKFSHVLLEKYIQKLVQEGVNSKDASYLAKFLLIINTELSKAPLFKNLDEDQDDMHIMRDYKIDNEGNVIELHMHHAESITMASFPEQLCFLKNLEVIRFPNNAIEFLPECIMNLKFLRVLDVNNFEGPTAMIPNSIKAFIESLESYNEFYRH